jgi:hypothetical protein
VRVKVNGVDVFHPTTGEVRSGGPDGIACWFVDTDYNEESFFVRQAYAALAYYHANREEIDADLAAEEALTEAIERQVAQSPDAYPRCCACTWTKIPWTRRSSGLCEHGLSTVNG